MTPTAAGDGGGVCAGKEAVVSNRPTWDLETEAQAEPAAVPSLAKNSLKVGIRWLGLQQTLGLGLKTQESKFDFGVHG